MNESFDPADDSPAPRISVLACGVLEEEVRHFARKSPQLVSIRVMESGLHDTPERLRSELQRNIDEIEATENCDAIALVYGLCSCGTENLVTRTCRLVMARAHDCITLLLGSKERYASYQKFQPGTYWYSPGWNKNMNVPGKDRYEKLYRRYLEKFGKDNAEYLIEADKEGLSNYNCAAYVDLGVGDSEKEARYCRDCAQWMGWDHVHLKSDQKLLRDLLCGAWDDQRFLVLEPGETFRFSIDENVIKAVKYKEEK